MRLLYASNLYPPSMGGAQLHMHCLAKAMQSVGNETAVVTHSCRHRTDWLRLSTVATESDQHLEYEGIPVWQLGFSRFTRAQILPWALSYYGLIGPATRHISRHTLNALSTLQLPDVVHATRIGREFICRATLDFAHRNNRPFVLTPVHHERWHGWRYTEYDKIYREADALCVLTMAEKRLLVEQKGVDAGKIHITGVGPVLSATYDAEEFRARYNIPGRFVLYLGQQFRYKGVGAVLQAARLLRSRHPDVTFVFVGPPTGYSQALFSSVSDPRIRNLGELSLQAKTSALAACEFLCLPSCQESFGGVYLEAWSLGKTVIGGRIPPVAELISEGEDGLLSSQDPEELSEQLSALLANPEQCARMGNAGCRKVQKRYTWERIAKQTYKIYQSVAGIGD